MTFKEVYDITVPEAKRKEERLNVWVAIAVRPLSVWLTIPFIKTKIKPTSITAVSILFSVVGAILLSLGDNMLIKILGWLGFFAWAVLDGVDGNLARCQNTCSSLGDLWDTMGGYAAMVLMYFSAGIAAFFDNNLVTFCDSYLLLILGGATAVFSIFPRLVMHKKKSSVSESNVVKDLSDMRNYSFSKAIGLNLISPSGFVQVVFLVCIVFHLLNVFIGVYFLINLLVMMYSLYGLLRE